MGSGSCQRGIPSEGRLRAPLFVWSIESRKKDSALTQAHGRLDALTTGIMTRKVSGVLDADVRARPSLTSSFVQYIVYSMQTDSPLHRPNLSDDLAAVVRQMIFDGRLAAGERINEVRLAAQLGVSRTPLREALAGLVAEAAVYSVPRQGFFVCPLSLDEARNIYPIRAFLDPEALRLSGIPSRDRLAQLDALNRKLRTADDVGTAVRLDEDWYRTLWAECPNPVLVELIEQFMRRTRRYELASMGQPRVLRSTTQNRARVVKTLREGRLARACTLVRQSLLHGGKPVFEWLERRDRESNRTREE